MTSADLVGYLAATLTTIAFVPQTWKTFRSRSAAGVSLRMYLIFTAGVTLWLAYGLLIGAWPVIVANCVTLVLALFILVMRVKYGDPTRPRR